MASLPLPQSAKVVIPIQTISFYNKITDWSDNVYGVVIPIQTISFYNSKGGAIKFSWECCHTYPNDKLLQRPETASGMRTKKLSYLSKR